MSGIHLALLGSSFVVKDPNFANVTLLLNGDGTNGTQNNTFLDSSTNNFTITRNGNVTQGSFSPYTAAAPYSTATKGGSGYFGVAGDFLATTSSQVIPSGSYTIEAWVYTTSASDTQTILAQGTGVGDANRTTVGIESSSGAKWSAQVGAFSVQSSFAVVPNVWTHVAMTFNGTTITLWVDGVSAGSTANVLNASNTTLQVGKNWGTYQWIGYISNARVSNTVRYTATFTPQTTPFTSDANTTFLGGFTNAGIPDLAMQNNLETVGNAQVSTSVKKYGTGSISFDGTGDFLSYPSSVFGGGNFTVEGWVYFNSTSGDQTIFGINWNSNANSLSAVRVDISSGVFRYMGSTDGSNFYFFQATSTSPSTSTWYHIALVRNSGTVTFYVDGTSVNSTSSVPNALYAGTGGSRIGNILSSGNNYLNGYVDDFRITNGVARYTANFTPPTVALLTF